MKPLQRRRTAYATRIKLIKMRVHNTTAASHTVLRVFGTVFRTQSPVISTLLHVLSNEN